MPMPTRRIGTRPLKSARARHLPKHSPKLSLDVDAPSGTYHIDETAAKLYKQGVFLNREPFEMFLKKLRRSVDIAGYHSLVLAQNTLVQAPSDLKLTERFFEDVKVISHLIDRNKKADPHSIRLSVKYLRHDASRPQPRIECQDRTSSLLTKLRDVRAEIEGYLLDYRPGDGRRGGNHDPLSSYFISEMLEVVWREFGAAPPEDAAGERPRIESGRELPEMSRAECRPFARLLAAAWRDAGFPLVDHRNRSREPLEDWFADRVRKQFFDKGLPTDEF
jgi:hypothetical protein